ncbi:hypothetical protein F7725_027866 [Dissostichus mawsoni]|uniref:Uncharacterized protein n=1 Tax=Dissostichus mawsoni TaxID=36200 RepID=A0A7J5XGG9_DISMA|nr:hypothetical protein F7725_027866 [Dissostichus mawsoni]
MGMRRRAVVVVVVIGVGGGPLPQHGRLQHRDNSVLSAALLWLCLAVREDLQLDLPQSHPSLLLPYLTPLESCRDRMLGGARAAAVKQQRWRCESQWISGMVTCHVTRRSRKSCFTNITAGVKLSADPPCAV